MSAARVRTAAGTVHSVRRVIPEGGGWFDGRPIDRLELSCGMPLPAAHSVVDAATEVTCKRCMVRTPIDDLIRTL